MIDDYAEAVRALEHAVVVVLQLGIPCDGWVLQRSSADNSWTAWLYVEAGKIGPDDDEESDPGDHVSLFAEAAHHASAREAASWCLGEAGRLLDNPPKVEIS